MEMINHTSKAKAAMLSTKAAHCDRLTIANNYTHTHTHTHTYTHTYTHVGVKP